ncbi:MAG: hypothetical protein JNK11_03120 [Alphaproteobacteria bacterium]|nr:hypothetical protein [Alphaproteobacteria bacterium]
MEIRSSSVRVGASPATPFRQRLADLRQRVRAALEDDWENPQFPLDMLDLSWLASLPRTLPRGSILNILV